MFDAVQFDSLLGPPEIGCVMSCRICLSNNQAQFGSEMFIHFPGMKSIDKPAVLAFPLLVVCLDCGHCEFTIPESELRLLAQGGAESRAA
jgi:hypothetical protein